MKLGLYLGGEIWEGAPNFDNVWDGMVEPSCRTLVVPHSFSYGVKSLKLIATAGISLRRRNPKEAL